jgi:thiamine monophosphate synthase
LPAHWILTAAAHSPAALKRAETIGADAILAGPAFATASHPDAEALGPHRFSRLLGAARIPVYALGGVNQKTMRKLPTQRLAGNAGIGGYL